MAAMPGTFLGREVRRVAGEDGHARVGAVDGHDPVGVVEPEVAAHVAADVPARRGEPRVAEDTHEAGPPVGHRDGVGGRAGRAVGVPVARHVGHDHIERVGGVGAVRAGVGQQRNDLRVAPKGVRPAVAQDQRQNEFGRRGDPDVHEVDLQATQPDAEAGEPGERRLLRRPLEPLRPVGDELAEVTDVGPEQPQASSGASGQRVARSRARRSSSAAGAACGVNGSGRGSAAADGASGMRRILRAGGRRLREDARGPAAQAGAGGGTDSENCTVADAARSHGRRPGCSSRRPTSKRSAARTSGDRDSRCSHG